MAMRVILSIISCVLLVSCASVREPKVARCWLARVQNTNGSWGETKKDRYLLTSLALMSFLASGETPLSETYGNTVQKAMLWLCRNAGSIPRQKNDPNYQYLPADVIVAKVLADSYGMTRIPCLKKSAEGLTEKLLKEKRQSLWHHEAYRASYLAGIPAEGLLKEIERRTDNVATLKVPSALGDLQVATTAHEVIKYGAETETETAWEEALQKIPPVNWRNPGDEWPLITWWFTNWTYEATDGGRTKTQREQRKKWLTSLTAAMVKHQNRDGFWDMPGDAAKPTREAARFRNKRDARIYATAILMSTQWPTRRLPTLSPRTLKKMRERQARSSEGIGTDENELIIEIQ